MRRTGQIAVLVLLLSMLGLVVGLSATARSLSDLKQVTYVDAGTRALAAAEAGLQYAFFNASLAGAGPDCSTAPDNVITGLSLSGIKALTYRICQVSKNYITVPGVLKDDVVEVDLTNSNPNLQSIDVSWKGDASVEISVLDSDNTLRRYAYNANTAAGLGRNNGFAPGTPGSNCSVGCDPSFSSGSCSYFGEIPFKLGTPPVQARLIRVRPVYQSSDINICGRVAGNSNSNFGLQYYRIVVTATTSNGSVRRLQADRYPAGLPAVFENVFYSGGDIIK